MNESTYPFVIDIRPFAIARRFSRFSCHCLLFALLMLGNSQAAERPNVLVIFIDDMGYADPSCFGNPAMTTPNIDRLADEGIKLTNFYVNSPICSASRVALTTGQYQQRYRIHSFFATRKSNRNRKMPNWLDPKAPTLAKLLKTAGYRTAHFGKWHMGGGRDVGDAPLPQAYGFEESLVSFEGLGDRILWQKTGNQKQSWAHGRGEILDLPKHKTTETYVDHAIEFMSKHKEEPFYVRVFPNDVHDAHVPSEEQRKRWEGKSDKPPDIDFFAVLDEMDRQIGRLLDTIDDLGLAEETLVLFTSDNGPTDWPRYYQAGHDPPGFTGPLFGRKWSLYEGGIRMPFIARWPGKIPAGTTNDSSVMAAIDVLPTIASICEVEDKSVNSDGVDLSDALFGKPIERTKPLFWEYGVHGSIKPGKKEHVSPNLAMREQHWKLLCNPDGSDTKLFNLAKDIGESTDVAADHPQIAAKMKGQLLTWWRTMDAYYAGPKETNAKSSAKPKVWIYTDMSDPTLQGNNHRGTINDTDDVSAMAGYLLLANEFETLGIVVASTHRKEHRETPSQADWANQFFGDAYRADLKRMNDRFGGYPSDISFTQSSIKATAERFSETNDYRSLDDYATVKALLDQVHSLDKGEQINVLCWGSLTEPAILVTHCLATKQSDLLKRLRFIAHWTNSPLHQGTKEHPEQVANCAEDATACAYMKQQAKAGAITYYECGAIGQHGIVSGSPKGDEYFSRFRSSRLGKIFVEGKYVRGHVDHSDSATYWTLLGEWGVSLQDIASDGTNDAKVEQKNENAFRNNSKRIHDELLRRCLQ